jgi:hypothetical protein
MNARVWPLALMLCAAAAAHAADAGDDLAGDWNFEASLDGKPIGHHRFTVAARADGLSVRSVASFDVKFIGITAYRYRHQATESWRGGCLAELTAHTDDDGKVSDVKASRSADQLLLSGPAGKRSLPGCVMTFAYWNPAIQRQTQLLNPQTGQYEKVQVSAAGTSSISVRGKAVEASHVRIGGAEAAIDVWYSPQGDWIGLDSVVGSRKLSYRLK